MEALDFGSLKPEGRGFTTLLKVVETQAGKTQKLI